MSHNSARVFQLNVSDGGVPKLPVQQVHVTKNGILGDRQQNLEHHGGPLRAVCLYALELTQALQAEGHPIFVGSIGENISISGLDWQSLTSGTRLRLGSDVVIELTSMANPCSKLTEYFSDGVFSRISQKTHPGWSRWYARVLTEGAVRVSDLVAISVDE